MPFLNVPFIFPTKTDEGLRLANEWWHRRIFTRAIKNIQDQRPGFRMLSGGIDDVHAIYQSDKVKGTLSLEEIRELVISGWY